MLLYLVFWKLYDGGVEIIFKCNGIFVKFGIMWEFKS